MLRSAQSYRWLSTHAPWTLIDAILRTHILQAGQQVLHTKLKLPVLKNRDMVCMRAFRESEVPGVGQRFEMMER